MKNRKINILLYVVLLTAKFSYSQDYKKKIAESVCVCIEGISEELVLDDYSKAFNNCIQESYKPFKKQFEEEYNLDLGSKDTKTVEENYLIGKKIGKILGPYLYTACPDSVLNFVSVIKKKSTENANAKKEK